jgi:hypothetical protein
MTEPLLHSRHVHAVAQVIRCKRMSGLVKEEVHATPDSVTLVIVLGDRLHAIQAGALRNALHNHIHFALAATIGEDKPIGERLRASLRLRKRSIRPAGSGRAPPRFWE